MEYPKAKPGFQVFHGPGSMYELMEIQFPSSCSSSFADPYIFNLNGPPIGTISLREHKLHFPTSDDWDRLEQKSIWRSEPKISDIKEVMGPVLMQLCLASKHLKVEICATGSFKRRYRITACHQSCTYNADSGPGNPLSCEDFLSTDNTPCPGYGAKIHLLLQLTPSIFPWFKTESEVSTMEFLRARTTIPIPRVYAFDSSVDNSLGFEWILMDETAGGPYDKMKSKLTGAQKKQVQKAIASYVKEITKLNFTKIGSIYRDWNVNSTALESSTASVYKLGPIVDMKHLNGGGYTVQNIKTAHPCIKEYLASFITSRLKRLIHKDMIERTQQPQNLFLFQKGHGDVPRQPHITRKQQGSLKSARFIQTYRRYINVFENCSLLAEENEKMQTHLSKAHMQESTFYVDEKGNVTGIYDWDFVVTLPPALLPANAAQILPVGAVDGLVLMHEQLTEELEMSLLAAKDEEKEKSGAALGRLMRLVATYLLGLEENRERAERLVGRLERWDENEGIIREHK